MGVQTSKTPHTVRLEEASRRAHEAEANGDDAAAIAAWREYRLVRDAGRPAEDLLEEGITLSKMADRLIEPR
ncbi:MAG TPA: hypothetical protein PKA56_03585 [Solirubrobacterales bacterium]|nr:hypothetical protein [Solirubrobacterales bacterium]HMU26001.1 hypothetical protein [Solirubrobacterales bacterium]HMW44799.1 hypothetical protein [Solirubrobacterales bacterium]HMX70815.1 hypothetical protein [Solirubrobacterales bacterium]HMY25048.1 hypothetical protein [Solirubrobacterales bacterium]